VQKVANVTARNATAIVDVQKEKSVTATVNAKTEKSVTVRTATAIVNAKTEKTVPAKTIAHTKTAPQKNRDAVAVDTKSNSDMGLDLISV
jgi:hypothetical protein